MKKLTVKDLVELPNNAKRFGLCFCDYTKPHRCRACKAIDEIGSIDVKIPSVEDIENVINETYCVACDVFTAKGVINNPKTIATAIHALITERKRNG